MGPLIWLMLACTTPEPAPPPPSPLAACHTWVQELAPLRQEGVTVPSEAKVLRACALVPEAVRPCLPPSGWIAHPKQCREKLDSLPPPVEKEIRLLLGDQVRKLQRLDAPPPQR